MGVTQESCRRTGNPLGVSEGSDDDVGAGLRCRVTQQFAFTYRDDARTSARLSTDAFEESQRLRPTDPISDETRVVLELDQRANGHWTKDSVCLTAIEAKLRKIRLQLLHVVTTQVWRCEIQEPRSKEPRRFDEELPRRLSADAVCGQPSGQLECNDGISRGVAIEAQLDRVGIEEVQCLQALLSAPDRFAALAAG